MHVAIVHYHLRPGGVTRVIQHNRDLAKMSFGILHTFLLRIQSLGILKELPELGQALHQFQARDIDHERIDHTIQYEERPPMIEVPAYREKFGLE